MEEVLHNSFKGIRCEDSVVELICSHFGDDIDKPALIRQLERLQDARRSQTSEAVAEPSGELPLAVTIATVIACMRKLGQHITMFSEVVKLLELFLLLPVTSATAERSFSGSRSLKSFMRTCLSQELLNSLAILRVPPCPQVLDMSTGCYQRGQGVLLLDHRTDFLHLAHSPKP